MAAALTNGPPIHSLESSEQLISKAFQILSVHNKGQQSGAGPLQAVRRKSGLALALIAALFAFAACANDLNPSGGWSSPVQDEGFLYFGNKDGTFVRVSAETGHLDTSWRFPASDDLGEVYGNPVIVDGVVYGSGYSCRGNHCNGHIFAATVDTGASAWAGGQFDIDTKLVGTVALGDGVLVAGTSTLGDADDPKGFLLALDSRADAGQEEQVESREKWQLPVDGAVWSSAAVLDNVAYFGTMGGTLYAVDLADRPEYESDVEARVLWTFEVGSAIAGPVLAADGKLYFGAFNNNVYALDIAIRAENPAGTELDSSSEWAFDTGAWVWAMPLLHEGVLYVTTLGGGVYALNPETAQPVPGWTAPAKIDGEIVAQPVVIDSIRGPALAVPSGEGDVHVVVLANGQVSGRFDTGGSGVKSSPALVGDSLFVHTLNGLLRVFNTSNLSQELCIEPKGDGKQC